MVQDDETLLSYTSSYPEEGVVAYTLAQEKQAAGPHTAKENGGALVFREEDHFTYKIEIVDQFAHNIL
jgi:hypothetical protein